MNRNAGTLVAVSLSALVAACGSSSSDPVVEETFQNPTQLSSSGGQLRTTLTVAAATFTVGGQRVTSAVYNGSYTPPVLRLRPGDTLFLELDNRYDEPTNVHYHGLNVSPRINADATVSDNIFVQVDPGRKLNYQVAIPGNHNAGLYWYHTHKHELAQRQVMGGLSGGLVIDGILDPFPDLAGVKERIMLLKDIQITPQGTVPDDINASAPTTRSVNGLVNPTLVIQPNETQFLRLANIGADLYYRIRLEGHVLHEIARDGNRHNQTVVLEELLLPPGSRSEILIQGAAHGTYPMRAEAFNTGPAGDSYPATTLATLVSQGAVVPKIPLPRTLTPVEDFRTLPVAKRRTITFTETADGNTFFIDSGAGPKQFDPNVVDSTIQVGTVEEWTVVNATAELHTFHIHQTDFQVTEVDRVPQEFVGHQDNVNVPFQTAATGPGQVKVLIDFRNPIIVGRFVYHCHILEHEDAGMMAVAEVVPPTALSAVRRAVGGLQQAATRWVRGESDAERSARAERTLEAVQSGSFCETRPAPPQVRDIVRTSLPVQGRSPGRPSARERGRLRPRL